MDGWGRAEKLEHAFGEKASFVAQESFLGLLARDLPLELIQERGKEST